MNYLRKNSGFTLIELLIVLVLSSILLAGSYRTFIAQQKVYTVQDQVADTQQNVRVAIDKMTREIRMAGYGNINYVLGLSGGVNGFTSVITIIPGPNQITIVGAFKQIRRSNGEPIVVSSVSGNQVTLDYATDEFDGTAHRYISIGGIESNTVQSRSGATLTLATALTQTHSPGSPVYKIQAITYNLDTSDGKQVLRRNENTGGGAQSLAENIENLQFAYYDKDGIVTATPADIRMIKVTVLAKTDRSDPDFKGGDGFRRRELASFVKVRNMGL